MRKRLLAAMAGAALTIPLTAAAALADVPANDSPSGAVLVPALPWKTSQDTTEATTDKVDEWVKEVACGLSIGVFGSVWFTYTDATGDGFTADASASGFLASVAIVAGAPMEGEVVGCAENRASADGEPGQTYYVMAFSGRPSVPGGRLEVEFRALLPRPTAMLTVDRDATPNPDGSVTVTGTYTCANAYSDTTSLRGSLAFPKDKPQHANFFYLTGLECDGTAYRWSVDAVSDVIRPVRAGNAPLEADLFACGDLACEVATVQQRVLVRPGVSR